MNVGEHYVVTGNNPNNYYKKHCYQLGEIVKILKLGHDPTYINVISVSSKDIQIVMSEDITLAHQIYENGELKWVGPQYNIHCNREKYPELEATDDLCKEIIYNRPEGWVTTYKDEEPTKELKNSFFEVDEDVVFEKHKTKSIKKYIPNYTLGTLTEEIQICDQVEITCFGNSRVRGKVIGIADSSFEVEFRGCKGLFYKHELVKI